MALEENAAAGHYWKDYRLGESLPGMRMQLTVLSKSRKQCKEIPKQPLTSPLICCMQRAKASIGHSFRFKHCNRLSCKYSNIAFSGGSPHKDELASAMNNFRNRGRNRKCVITCVKNGKEALVKNIELQEVSICKLQAEKQNLAISLEDLVTHAIQKNERVRRRYSEA